LPESARNAEREAILLAIYEALECAPSQKAQKEKELQELLDVVTQRCGRSTMEIRAALMRYHYPDFYKRKRTEEALKGVKPSS
jgi:hypothetical protein